MTQSNPPEPAARVWTVGALCRAIADALEARFNPVDVAGEISGFARVASGHCYFSLKDESGQIKCAMFRRAAGMLDFAPRDGESVIARGRIGVYEPRGDLQLVVESMSRAGKGAMFEQFLRLKARLEAEGLFDATRKRPVPSYPRGIGLVTSLGGAALHDVVTVLRRRAPQVAVLLAAAQVQGVGAAQEMVQAIAKLIAYSRSVNDAPGGGSGRPPIDVLLLVRGGGAMEDLWAFNDESLARALASCPIPVITGVGHETDYCIADFVADLRAPTPTAAAELAAPQQAALLQDLDRFADGLASRIRSRLERCVQTLDLLGASLARPSIRLSREGMRLAEQERRLGNAVKAGLLSRHGPLQTVQERIRVGAREAIAKASDNLARSGLRLELTNPRQVLRRGFVWATGSDGQALSKIAQVSVGADLTLQFADGQASAIVSGVSSDS